MRKYNLDFPDGISDRQIEFCCFTVGLSVADGGLGKFAHFRKASDVTWPDVQWNPWLEWQIESLCDEEYAHRDGKVIRRSVNWTGCATAGKTFGAGFYAFHWWAAAPEISCVILTSTTKDMIRRRVWPVIQQFYNSARDPNSNQKIQIGHIVDSRSTVQAVKGDDKNAIFALAVRDGETNSAVANIKGMHAQRMLIVIDEAEKTPEAIFETLANLQKGCEEFIVLVIGNSMSHLDSHGLCCEPESGYSSITVESKQWKTKGVKKWQIPSGVCLHFDGKDSPNVKAGRTLYPYIYTLENYRAALELKGEENIGFWSMDRGFWVPDGLSNTVMTATMVEKYDGRGKFMFPKGKIALCGLDTAFGGDDCILQFAEMGELDKGKTAIQLTDRVTLKLSATEKHEIDYQIARQTMIECKARGVAPECFGLDATGTGRGVAAILSAEWSASIRRTEFGGNASERIASATDLRSSSEVYCNSVTELWYACREFLEGGQLKGLYDEAIIQFCSRTYEYKGKRISLQPKVDCKLTMGRSPDHADAISVVVDVARHLGATAGGRISSLDVARTSQAVESADRVWSEEGLLNNDAEVEMSW